jgi:hypothetical protein
LLSPLGVKIPPVGWTLENIRFVGDRSPPKWALTLSKYAWGKITPFAVARKFSTKLVMKSLDRYVRKI